MMPKGQGAGTLPFGPWDCTKLAPKGAPGEKKPRPARPSSVAANLAEVIVYRRLPRRQRTEFRFQRHICRERANKAGLDHWACLGGSLLGGCVPVSLAACWAGHTFVPLRPHVFVCREMRFCNVQLLIGVAGRIKE